MYTFEEIVGHDKIVEHLQNSIKYNKLAHAYILNGADGSGKKLLAKTLAKTVECEEGDTTPCDQCLSCRTFDTDNNPDVIFIKSTKKSIGVDVIREQIQKDIDIKPYKYKYKVYIIENAEKLTEQAQNALLKTIEEPPSYALILFLTNNYNKFIATIISRCVVLKLRPIKVKLIKDFIVKNKQIPEYQANLFANFGQGSIGKSLELASSEEFIQMRSDVFSLLCRINNTDEFQAMQMYKELEGYKENILDVLDLMNCWYRDLLFIKQFGNNEYIVNIDKIEDLTNQSEKFTVNKISKNIDAITEAKSQLTYHANFQLTLEMLLLKIK